MTLSSSYQNKRVASITALEPTTAKYLLDFLYFTREDEQFRFYKKVSKKDEFPLKACVDA